MGDENEVGRLLKHPIVFSGGETEPITEAWWAQMNRREGRGWSGGVGGNVPVQGAGVVDGLPWYFRARWRGWTLRVSDAPDGDPVDEFRGTLAAAGEHGDPTHPFSAGWMTVDEAWGFIEKGLADFLAARHLAPACAEGEGRACGASETPTPESKP